MISQTFVNPIPLCSRCITHEINAWIIDKRAELDPEITQKIREELKSVKLTQGECVVCSNSLISHETFNNILKILDKNKVSEEIVKEFKNFFGFEK